jgi:hypothetical protein
LGNIQQSPEGSHDHLLNVSVFHKEALNIDPSKPLTRKIYPSSSKVLKDIARDICALHRDTEIRRVAPSLRSSSTEDWIHHQSHISRDSMRIPHQIVLRFDDEPRSIFPTRIHKRDDRLLNIGESFNKIKHPLYSRESSIHGAQGTSHTTKIFIALFLREPSIRDIVNFSTKAVRDSCIISCLCGKPEGREVKGLSRTRH